MKKGKIINRIVIAVNSAVLAVCAVLYGCIHSLQTEYTADNAKQLWDNELYSYSQVSVFLTPGEGIDDMTVYGIRKQIDGKLKEGTAANKDKLEKGRLWIDCASGESTLTVSGNMGSCEVIATGTFGDYFLFHPERLVSGSYYTEDDVNYDRIVIDKTCSWQLFGAVDTAGMPVTIGNKVYYVAAVTEIPEDKDDITAYGSIPRIYMPYETLRGINSGAVMTSYEVCMPNVVRDYALTVITELSIGSENSTAIIDQSSRFGIIRLFQGFGKISENAMIRTNLAYPWYENRIRGAEIIAQIIAGPLVYMMIIPAVSLVYAIYMICRLIGAGIRRLRDEAEKRYQKKISEAYYKKKRAG